MTFDEYERLYAIISIIIDLTVLSCIICSHYGDVYKFFLMFFIMKICFHNGYMFARGKCEEC